MGRQLGEEETVEEKVRAFLKELLATKRGSLEAVSFLRREARDKSLKEGLDLIFDRELAACQRLYRALAEGGRVSDLPVGQLGEAVKKEQGPGPRLKVLRQAFLNSVKLASSEAATWGEPDYQKMIEEIRKADEQSLRWLEAYLDGLAASG